MRIYDKIYRHKKIQEYIYIHTRIHRYTHMNIKTYRHIYMLSHRHDKDISNVPEESPTPSHNRAVMLFGGKANQISTAFTLRALEGHRFARQC